MVFKPFEQAYNKVIEDYGGGNITPEQVIQRWSQAADFIRNKITFISMGPSAPHLNPFNNQVLLRNGSGYGVSVTMLEVDINASQFKAFVLSLNGQTIQPSAAQEGLKNMILFFLHFFCYCINVTSVSMINNSNDPGATEVSTTITPCPATLSDPFFLYAINPSLLSVPHNGCIAKALEKVIKPEPNAIASTKINKIDTNGNKVAEMTLGEAVSSLEKRNQMYEYIFESVGNILFGKQLQQQPTDLQIVTTYTAGPAVTTILSGLTPPVPPIVPNLSTSLALDNTQ